jgi:hypothetical protein
LYIIIRTDLTPGQKLAQACHVAFSFCQENQEVTHHWINISNYICLLESNNIEHLFDQAKMWNIKCSSFREPDLDYMMTALALEPGPLTKKLCNKLPLALK